MAEGDLSDLVVVVATARAVDAAGAVDALFPSVTTFSVEDR